MFPQLTLLRISPGTQSFDLPEELGELCTSCPRFEPGSTDSFIARCATHYSMDGLGDSSKRTQTEQEGQMARCKAKK